MRLKATIYYIFKIKLLNLKLNNCFAILLLKIKQTKIKT